MMATFTFAMALLNIACKLALVALNTRMLRKYRHRLNHRQRGGLSVTGGGCLLTVPLALDPLSGFNLWAPIILVGGMLLFLWGSMDRLWIHEQANADGREEAADYLKRRGKL